MKMKERLSRECKFCKGNFYYYPYEENRAKYCSKGCFYKGKKGRTPWNKGKKMSLKHRMNLNNHWKSLKGKRGIRLGKKHNRESLIKISNKSKGFSPKRTHLSREYKGG